MIHPGPETLPSADVLSPECRAVLISVNPRAGARSGLPAVQELAQRLQPEFDVQLFQQIGELSEASAELQRRGQLRAVVAAGGDGTVGLVLNSTPEGTPIAILPLGTENLLAKYLGIRPTPQAVAELIRGGLITRLDAGLVNGRLFLLMTGCGFDADVVHRLHAIRKGNIHHLSYAKPILDAIRSYAYPPIQVYCPAEIPAAAPLPFKAVTDRPEREDSQEPKSRLEIRPPHSPDSHCEGVPSLALDGQASAMDGQASARAGRAAGEDGRAAGEDGRAAGEDGRATGEDGRATGEAEPTQCVLEACWVFVVNLPCYARGLRLAPTASATDGQLDVCTFRQGSLYHGLRYLGGVMLGQHTLWPDCRILPARRLVLTSAAPVPFQIDGDPGGFLPAEFQVAAGRFTAVVPSDWLQRYDDPGPA